MAISRLSKDTPCTWGGDALYAGSEVADRSNKGFLKNGSNKYQWNIMDI
jgi:hypothetical protein